VFAFAGSTRVSDPCLLPRTTPAGRLQVRVLFTQWGNGGDAGDSAIGFAARYGDEGPLEAEPAPVYAVGAHESAPALFEWTDGSMLYVAQDRPAAGSATYPAIAAALAPTNATLPAPTAYADSP
jgi:hypothetical protein